MRTHQRRTVRKRILQILYTPFTIFATRSIALRFGRGAMVGACRLLGRERVGVAMAPPMSDVRESERREEITSPCADAGREYEGDGDE